MNPINPKEFRYIKLGGGGSWAELAFERGELHFGYPASTVLRTSPPPQGARPVPRGRPVGHP